MASLFNSSRPCTALVAVAQDFHRRGWMLGTAGNLSARALDAPSSFWITASGKPKGQLEEIDFLRVAVDNGDVLETAHPTNKPSAETSIHQAIYRLIPEAGACFHVHSVNACLATNQTDAQGMALPPLEMIKGLGIWEQDPQIHLPLFDNILDVPQIAQQIRQRFSESPPVIPALMIRNHGITVWGSDIQEAYNRVELVEFIMEYIARRS